MLENKSMSYKRIKTREAFIERANSVWGNEYTYDKVKFTPRENGLNWKKERKRKLAEYNPNEKITVTCRHHGDFEVTARKHIERGPSKTGCKYCSWEKRSKVRYNKRKEADFTDTNDHIIEESTVKIFSTPSDDIKREILISLEDVDILRYANWYVTGHQESRNSRTHYCVAPGTLRLKSENLQWLGKKPKMHRLIMSRILGRELNKSELVDHINGNGLDNRRENLRIVTNSQNHMNKKKPNGSYTSIYKGVYKDSRLARNGKIRWASSIKKSGTKKEFLGRHDTEEEAARAYDKRAKELFGEYACLNFPDE